MKKYFIMIIIVLFSTKIWATDVVVVIKGIKTPNKMLYISVCDEENLNSKTPEKDCFINQSVRIGEEKEYIFKFKNIPEGQYAFFGYVDENLNGKINTTIFGIPTEDVFYSANVTPFFFKGPPRFKKIKSKIKGKYQEVILTVQ